MINISHLLKNAPKGTTHVYLPFIESSDSDGVPYQFFERHTRINRSVKVEHFDGKMWEVIYPKISKKDVVLKLRARV